MPPREPTEAEIDALARQLEPELFDSRRAERLFRSGNGKQRLERVLERARKILVSRLNQPRVTRGMLIERLARELAPTWFDEAAGRELPRRAWVQENQARAREMARTCLRVIDELGLTISRKNRTEGK